MGGVIALTVQLYFCYRIWTLSRNVWLCSLIIAVCVPDPLRDRYLLDVSLT